MSLRQDQWREPLEILRHPRGPHRDVDLLGARVRITADGVDDLIVRPGQHSATDAAGKVAELPTKALLVVREADVHRARDRRRVAADGLTMLGEHASLVSEVVDRDER